MKLPTLLRDPTGVLQALPLLSSLWSSQKPLSSVQLTATGRRQLEGKVFTPTDYEVVPGFFLQSSATFDPRTFSLLDDSFGLLPAGHAPDHWSRFIDNITRLNEHADNLTTYKVLYIARHGQGFHNVAEAKYGTPAWNAHWSRLNTDGEIVWGPDPLLTPLGHAQAANLSRAWHHHLALGAPPPQSLYSSPLSRAAATLHATWHPNLDFSRPPLQPLFKEHLRETIGLHTCDRRSDKATLAARFPGFAFDVPFAEHDQLWAAEFQEGGRQQALRAQQLLNELFARDAGVVLSLTAHGGVIQALCRALGHPIVPIRPGEFLPVVVKAVGHPKRTTRHFGGGQSVEAAPLSLPTPIPRRIVEL